MLWRLFRFRWQALGTFKLHDEALDFLVLPFYQEKGSKHDLKIYDQLQPDFDFNYIIM